MEDFSHIVHLYLVPSHLFDDSNLNLKQKKLAIKLITAGIGGHLSKFKPKKAFQRASRCS